MTPALVARVARAARQVGPDAPVVFVVALVARFGLLEHSDGGPGGEIGYDAGVYYAAAAALIHGRWPYHGFVLLHPPALMLLLTPFALLGRLTSDHTGFITANACFEVLAAATAVLVHRVVSNVGAGRAGALVAGLFYALWYGAVYAEVGVRLEPLGSFAFVLGLWLIRDGRPGRVRLLGGGAALGVAVCTKIWWIVPVVVVLGWACRPSARRTAKQVVPGAVGASVLVCGPFFAYAPRQMWRMVVTDQLGRRTSTPWTNRVNELTGASTFSSLHGHRADLVSALIVAVALAGVIAAWRNQIGRLPVLLSFSVGIVLLASPTYFTYYGCFAAAPIALTLGCALAPTGAAASSLWRRTGALSGVASLLLAFVITAAVLTSQPASGEPFPAAQLAAGVRGQRCVLSDSPQALIQLNVLSRDFDNGCPNWVDVSGRSYDVDSDGNLARRNNPKWQRDILRYLLSGNALIVIRAQTGLSPSTLRVIAGLPVLARSGRYQLHASRPQ